ncbi:MAG: proton-conducting transporter membrane subunit [Bacillota bacterium]|nr:proton-conducting transporter membrane subunit [Bacillota bacterium]
MFNSIGEFLCHGANLIIFMVALPAICGILLWLFQKQYIVKLVIAILSSVTNLIFALGLSLHNEFFTRVPYAPFEFEFLFRVYDLCALFIVIAAVVFVLITLYTVIYSKKKHYGGLYLLYLYISFAMVNGALLSDSLGSMLFFWEGLLFPLFGILLIKNNNNPKTAVKTLTLVGLSDLLLMLGIIITSHTAGTQNLSEIENLAISGNGMLGFICIMLGALGMSGCMPFHSWIPNASDDSPTVFMVAFPGALQVILGVYLALRTVLDIYGFVPGSGISIIIMALGSVTLVFAAAMMLIQNDIKRLISYCAISQLGFLVMGIGSGLTDGIVGGLHSLIDYVFYITGLFMISGIIEKQFGTKDLRQLSGLLKRIPATMVCFIIFLLSVVGFPGFNGFLSKELIFNASLKTNVIFYICALLGTFLTALSFLRMGMSLFFEKKNAPSEIKKESKSSVGMLIPVVILSSLCIGIYSQNGLVEYALGIGKIAGVTFALIVLFAAAVLLAVFDYIYGYKKSGNALNCANHIIYAPGIKRVYKSAEKGYFDPYNWLIALVGGFSDICVRMEHGVSWVYDKAVPGMVNKVGLALHRFDNGRLSRYLYLVIGGLVFITFVFIIIK